MYQEKLKIQLMRHKQRPYQLQNVSMNPDLERCFSLNSGKPDGDSNTGINLANVKVLRPMPINSFNKSSEIEAQHTAFQRYQTRREAELAEMKAAVMKEMEHGLCSLQRELENGLEENMRILMRSLEEHQVAEVQSMKDRKRVKIPLVDRWLKVWKTHSAVSQKKTKDVIRQELRLAPETAEQEHLNRICDRHTEETVCNSMDAEIHRQHTEWLKVACMKWREEMMEKLEEVCGTKGSNQRMNIQPPTTCYASPDLASVDTIRQPASIVTRPAWRQDTRLPPIPVVRENTKEFLADTDVEQTPVIEICLNNAKDNNETPDGGKKAEKGGDERGQKKSKKTVSRRFLSWLCCFK